MNNEQSKGDKEIAEAERQNKVMIRKIKKLIPTLNNAVLKKKNNLVFNEDELEGIKSAIIQIQRLLVFSDTPIDINAATRDTKEDTEITRFIEHIIHQTKNALKKMQDDKKNDKK